MPLVVPERIDREDIEKYIKLLPLVDPREKIDRQDYSPNVANTLPDEGYINDEDIWSKVKAAAALVP